MRGKPEEKEICAAYRQTGREEKKMEDNRTLVQRTADQLVDYIVEQGLTEGDRLPSESELMKYLDVSPVSYTHLDVYKRQLPGFPIHTAEAGLWETTGGWLFTASTI